MGQVVQMEDHRAVDPLLHPQMKQLLRDWYSHSIGGTPCYGPVILTPWLGQSDVDPLHGVRWSMPKLMLAAQPVLAAWARDDLCDLDYVHAAVVHHPKLVVREWLQQLVDCGAIVSVGSDHTYEPTRKTIYRAFEIIMLSRAAWRQMADHSPDAVECLLADKDWVDPDTALPNTPNDRK